MEEYSFNLQLDERGDGEYRTQNDPSAPLQRQNITERRGAIDIRCTCETVIHGYMGAGKHFSTLIVYDFRFDTRKRARRIKSVDVEFLYTSTSEKQPEVADLAPDGQMILRPTVQSEQVTKGVCGGLGGNIMGAQVDAALRWEKIINRETMDATRIIGSADLKMRNYGNPNAVSWTLLENESTQTGVPAYLRTAVLLKRHDAGQFQCTVKINAQVDLRSKLCRVFGSKLRDDPIIYDPKLGSPDMACEYDLDNLDAVDLSTLSKAAFDE